MNPNPKIESYLDCGHELVCKPRASTTAGPTDGAARDSVARGAGGRTCRGASARHQEAHQRRACGASSGGRRSRAGPAPHRASGSGRRWLAPRPHEDARVLLGLLAPTPRRKAGPAHEARRRRLTARARRTRTRPAAAGPRCGGLRAALGGARPARSARGSWRCRRPDRPRMLPGPHQCCSVQHAAASRWRPARPRMRHRRPQLQERCALAPCSSSLRHEDGRRRAHQKNSC